MKHTKTPKGCVDLETHERELTALAVDLEAKARELLASDGRIHVATANQLATTATRARREAAQLAERREDVARIASLQETVRLIHAPAESTRPRLQFNGRPPKRKKNP